MPMMGMVIILVFVYFTCIGLILSYSDHINPKYGTLFFVILDVIFFLGFYVNNARNSSSFTFMTFDNISPFTFTMIPFMYLVKDKVRQWFLNAISFFSVGMFLAMLITPQYAYLFSFTVNASMDYVLDALCHLNCSLFGIYLIASKQVKIDFSSLKKAVLFMYGVVAFGVTMNFLFKKNFFGMGPYSNFSIYMFDFFDDYWITLLAYLIGIFVVLAIGYQSNYLLQRLSGHYQNIEEDINIIRDEEAEAHEGENIV